MGFWAPKSKEHPLTARKACPHIHTLPKDSALGFSLRTLNALWIRKQHQITSIPNKEWCLSAYRIWHTFGESDYFNNACSAWGNVFFSVLYKTKQNKTLSLWCWHVGLVHLGGFRFTSVSCPTLIWYSKHVLLEDVLAICAQNVRLLRTLWSKLENDLDLSSELSRCLTAFQRGPAFLSLVVLSWSHRHVADAIAPINPMAEWDIDGTGHA